AERAERREGREGRRRDVEDVDRRDRRERLLAHHLDQVGERLEYSSRTGAVRPEAALHPREQLALDECRERHRDQQDVDDHEGLDQADPPGLAHVRETSTAPARAAANSSAARATPATRSCSIRARSSTDVPFELTRTVSPGEMPRTRASSVESSISGAGRWKASSGTRATAGPEKSGR